MSDKIEKTFYCRNCINSWRSINYDIDDDIAYSQCDICNQSCHEVPHYYFNIPKMMEAQKGKHTGPKTIEGKERSSMNGFKHGLRTKKLAIVAPAKKDRYPDCNGCPYYDECTPDKYCPINLSLITNFVAAYKDGKVNDLKEYAGFVQGNAAITLKMLFADILNHGTLVERVISSKEDETDMEGITNTEIVKEWQDNPSLKHIIKFIEILGITAEQQIMTPAKQTENQNIIGFIDTVDKNQQNLTEFQKEQTKKIEEIRTSILKASADKNNDEAYQEYMEEKAKNDSDNKPAP